MPAPDLFTLLKKNWAKHGIIPTVTLNTLSLGTQDPETGWYAKTYNPSSISMFVIPKQLQFKVLKYGLFIEHDAIGFTKDTVHEGDLITDQASNIYVVLAVRDRNILSQFMYSQVELKKQPQAALTGNWLKWTTAYTKFRRAVEKNAAASGSMKLYQMQIGSQDPETGWYIVNYQTTSTINCVILNTKASTKWVRPGKRTSYTSYGYTLDDVNMGDIVEDKGGIQYRVRYIMPISMGSKLVFYELGLERGDAFTMAHLLAILLDIRIINMGNTMSFYLQGATVNIYLNGTLIVTGITDALGTFQTLLLPGSYVIIISALGYQSITKTEVLSINTELIVNLSLAAPQTPPQPIPINPSATMWNMQESWEGVAGMLLPEAINKVETLSFGGQRLQDTMNRSESVVIHNT